MRWGRQSFPSEDDGDVLSVAARHCVWEGDGVLVQGLMTHNHMGFVLSLGNVADAVSRSRDRRQ